MHTVILKIYEYAGKLAYFRRMLGLESTRFGGSIVINCVWDMQLHCNLEGVMC